MFSNFSKTRKHALKSLPKHLRNHKNQVFSMALIWVTPLRGEGGLLFRNPPDDIAPHQNVMRIWYTRCNLRPGCAQTSRKVWLFNTSIENVSRVAQSLLKSQGSRGQSLLDHRKKTENKKLFYRWEKLKKLLALEIFLDRKFSKLLTLKLLTFSIFRFFWKIENVNDFNVNNFENFRPKNISRTKSFFNFSHRLEWTRGQVAPHARASLRKS